MNMNRKAYQPFMNNYVSYERSYERSPHRMRYQPTHHSLYSRPTAIPEPMPTTVYSRQTTPDYYPGFSGERGISPPGAHTLPTSVGQPVWWYEVEVFRDPNPIPIITRDPAPARLPYDYSRYRSTPFVTEIPDDLYDDRHLRRRGDDYFDRVVPYDRYIEDAVYSAPARARSVPLL